MKKFILLALILSACSSSTPSAYEDSNPIEMPTQETGIQTRTYTSTNTSLSYTVNFDNSKVTEKSGLTNVHDFEINTGAYPAYLSISNRKPDSADQSPEDFLKKYFAPTQTIPTADVYEIKGMEAYLFVMPDFSSSYTEFAVIPAGEEIIVFMFQCAGTDEASLAADRAVFVNMLTELSVN